MTKSFSVKNFNKEVNRVLVNANKEQKANVRCYMLLRALKYSVKGGAK
jgi:hypothetical protein